MRVVADATLLRERLGWKPELDSLETIVAHALGWERELIRRGAG